jgi:hypothetical protein
MAKRVAGDALAFLLSSLVLLLFASGALPPVGAAHADARAPEPARGGVGLLAAMEAGALTLAGRVERVEALDAHGRAASLAVERVLGARSDTLDRGAPVRIAWEELASGRPPRFAPGDRVLVCLVPLPSDSIWTQRIPDTDRRAHTATVAHGGDAFLLDPSLGTLDVLHHYLSLALEDRESPTGVGYLASLTGRAQPAIALDAARRLASIEGIGTKLSPGSAREVALALSRTDAEDGSEALSTALLSLSAAAASPDLAEALRAATRPRDPVPPARLFEALALAAGAMPEADAAWLLAREDAAYRVVVARVAAGPDAPAVLRRLVASDPAAAVRAAAVERLVVLEGAQALPAVLPALADRDASVRSTAATSAASLGPAAVSGLQSVVDGTFPPCAGSPDAPRAAIVALSLAGGDGRKALGGIATSHPDAALRKLAGIALGGLETHTH